MNFSYRPALCICVVLWFSLGWINALAQIPEETPKNEFRAVWLTTNFGLDFPSKKDDAPEFIDPGSDWPATLPGQTSFSPEQQKKELINIIQSASDIGLNAIIFQVVPRADAFYQSERLPWSSLLTGTMGEDPGWDPLEVLIRESHKRGMEVHAWVNIGRVGNVDMPMPDKHPLHITQTNEEWIEIVDDDYWLNHGIPDAREWKVQNINEIVENYDVDAIHLDFIRYPTGGFNNDQETFERYNENNIEDIDDWRRDNFTEFIRKLYPSIKELKPWVKVGATPVGHYRTGDFPWPALWGYDDVFQDSRTWLQEEINDYIIPQIYWTSGGEPDFDALVSDWSQNHFNREVYIGKGPFNADVRTQISNQIDFTRQSGAGGSAFFRFEHIEPEIDGT